MPPHGFGHEYTPPGIPRQERCSTQEAAYRSMLAIAPIPDINVADFDHVMSELNAEGYQVTPGIHVDFLTAPKPRNP
jgi:hypothetical protein